MTDAFRVDVGGTNILRNKTASYWGNERVVLGLNGDETIYSVGARLKF